MAEHPPRHLLIPFAGRGSPACRAALPALKLPNLESLLSRLSLADTDTQDESTRSPPHERALAKALGIAAADGCIPWAALEARQAGLATPDDTEGWGVVTLCNWQVGIDDVALGDPAAIEIDGAESAALLDVARPFFEEDGIALHASPRPAAGSPARASSMASPPPPSTARWATRSRSGRRWAIRRGRCAGCRTRCRCCSTRSA
jgi:hypothetical protein